MNLPRSLVLRIILAAAALSLSAPAHAIPAFARKYGTSCLTCHTVYPKLNPFGEAFRRNGYRFPGIDTDYVKQETVALGQEANKKTFPNSVWPGTIPISVPISIGFNGQALVIPSSTSTAGQGTAPGTAVALGDLVEEGHIWAGAALDDTISLWAELTFAGGTAEVEHAQVLFNDLIGPKHMVNLVVGKGFSNVTPFGPHSSYLADQMVPNAPVGTLLGGGSEWQLINSYTGLELNGVIMGRLGYALGANAGASAIKTNPENFYGHLGYKLGGMRLDGEGSTGAADALHPWAETALTVYGFGYRSNTFAAAGAPVPNDVANTFGFGARGQYESAELNVGWYHDDHNHGTDAGTSATAQVFFGELSYVVFPWMVPALRVENITLDPTGGTSVNAWHVMPGIAFLIRPNLKVSVVASWEHASGFPAPGGAPSAWQGGSGDPAGGFTIAPLNGAGPSSEFETIAIFLAWAI